MRRIKCFIVLFALLSTLPLVFCSCGECEHIWDKGYIAKEATHEEEGFRVYTCTECGGQRAEKIDKLPHKPKDHTYDKGKWGNDETYHWLICDHEVCGATTNKTYHTLTSSPNGGFICQVCKRETSVHTFTDNMKTDAKFHWLTCDDLDCPVIGFMAPHSFTGEKIFDETHHWCECSNDICTVLSPKTEHTFEETDEGTLKCTGCNATK